MDVVGVYVMCIVATAYWCNVIVLWNVWVEQSHDFPLGGLNHRGRAGRTLWWAEPPIDLLHGSLKIISFQWTL